MFSSDINIEIINAIINLIIVVIFAIAGQYVVPWITTKINQEKLDLLISFARIAVNGVEQIFNEPNKGTTKYKEVFNIVSQKASNIGIKLSNEEIEIIIENLVKELNEQSDKLLIDNLNK